MSADFLIFKMAAVRQLGFVIRMLGTTHEEYIFDGLLRRAKSRWNWLCSSEDIRVSMLGEFSLMNVFFTLFWSCWDRWEKRKRFAVLSL